MQIEQELKECVKFGGDHNTIYLSYKALEMISRLLFYSTFRNCY